MTKRPPRKTPPPGAQRTVADLLLAGVGRDAIRNFLAEEDNFRPTARQLDELIAGALEDLRRQAAEYRDDAGDLTIVRLNDLYTRSLKAQDLKTALDVVRALTRYVQASAPPAAKPSPAPATPAAGTAGRIGYGQVMGAHRPG